MTRAIALGLACVGALLSLPLWLAEFPPLQDLSANTEVACQLLRVWRGEPAFTDVLFVHPQPWANSLPWIVLAALLAISPSLAMAKLMLSLSLVGWLLAIGWMLARLGRSAWLALLCAPLAFDLAWSYGFFHYLLAKLFVPLCIGLTSCVITASDRRRALLWTGALAGALVLTFLVHSLAWLVACGCVVVVTLVLAVRARDLIALAAVLVSALVALPFQRASQDAGTPGFRTVPREPAAALDALWDNLGNQNAQPIDGVPFALLAAALVLALAFSGRAALQLSRARAALLLCALCGLFAWARGPEVLPQVSVVSPRLLSLAVMFLVVGLAPAVLAPRARALVVMLMCAAACIHVVDLSRHYRAFSEEEMGDFNTLLASVPRGARVATHYTTPFSPHARHNALWHWGKLSCLEQGAITDDLFAYRKTAYVEVRPEARARVVLPPHRLRREALAAFDVLLVGGERSDRAHSVRALGDTLEPLAAAGRFTLYRVVH